MPRIVLDDVNKEINRVSRKIDKVRKNLHGKARQEQAEYIQNAKPILREFQELLAKQNLWGLVSQVRFDYEGIRFCVIHEGFLEKQDIIDGVSYSMSYYSSIAQRGIAKTIRAMRTLAGITKENASGEIEVSLEGVDYNLQLREVRKPHNSLFEYHSSSHKPEADKYSLEVLLVKKPQAVVLVA